MKPQVIIHGSDSHVILHVLGQKTTVHHVEVEGIVHLDVHIALQGRPYALRKSEHYIKGGESVCSVICVETF